MDRLPPKRVMAARMAFSSVSSSVSVLDTPIDPDVLAGTISMSAAVRLVLGKNDSLLDAVGKFTDIAVP